LNARFGSAEATRASASKASFQVLAAAALFAWLPALLVPPAPAAGIPAGFRQARERLDQSPRHGEWVDIQDAGDTISAWVVYPERPDKAPLVIVIHPIDGLTDWPRAVADQFAAEGFIAVAPDLLSGKRPGTNPPLELDAAAELVGSLDPAEVARRLAAVVRYGRSLPSATGKFACAGFGWGGGACFDMAEEQSEMAAAVIYDGSLGSAENVGKIHGTVLGFYGGSDTLTKAAHDAEAELKRLGKSFEKQIYEDAANGFLASQDGQDDANFKAAQQAWRRTIEFLKEKLD
jgi:carboxymethylenebutenolidase